MTRASTPQHLEHQTREFGASPSAQLIFTPADDSQADEIATTGDDDNGDLPSYTDGRLSSLLVQAQAHASYPRSE